MGLALLLMHSIESPKYAPYRLLNSHTMQYIGKISFSLYIWQQLFTSNSIEIFDRFIWCFSYPWFIVCIFVAALFSYYLLEKPFMGLQSRYRVAN
jgi:peptidoglycan/LPS O-acetylase OafA/YrhL